MDDRIEVLVELEREILELALGQVLNLIGESSSTAELDVFIFRESIFEDILFHLFQVRKHEFHLELELSLEVPFFDVNLGSEDAVAREWHCLL